MKKLLIAFILFVLPAHAGTITIQVTEAGQTTATKTFNIPDAHIDRMVAAYQAEANRSLGSPASRAQVLNFIAGNLVLTHIVQYVQGIEMQNASPAATAAIAPITPQ